MANRPTKAAPKRRKAAAKPTTKPSKDEAPAAVETVTPKKPRTTKKPAKRRPKNAAANDLAERRQEAIAEKAEAGEPVAETDAEQDIDLIIKKNRILDLRVRGATIRQISQRLEEDGLTGVKKSNVQKLLRAALDDAIDDNKLSAQQLLQLELEKLDRQELALFPNLLQLADIDRQQLGRITQGRGNARTVALALQKLGSDHVEKYSRSLERVLKLRVQLLSLAKPVKVEVSGENGGPIETAIRVILPKLPDENTEE